MDVFVDRVTFYQIEWLEPQIMNDETKMVKSSDAIYYLPEDIVFMVGTGWRREGVRSTKAEFITKVQRTPVEFCTSARLTQKPR
jgi:hypothetical protein